MRRPEELDRVDGLVIPGGESTTLGRLSVAFDVLEPPGTEQRTGRIVAVRQGQLLATSFHPELTPDRRVHRLFVQIVRDNA